MKMPGCMQALVLAAVLGGSGGADHAHAAAFAVNDTADTADASPGDGACADAGGKCTLRAAVMETNALAGEDEIDLPAGTYMLSLAGIDEHSAATGDLDINGSLTITGASASTTIINADNIDRVFRVGGGGAVTFSLGNVTIRNGTAGGGGGGGGGGIDISGNSTVSLTGCIVSNNTRNNGYGGGINVGIGSTLNMSGTTVSGNRADAGGGGISSGGTLNVSNSIVSGNTSTGPGAGIFIGGGGAASVSSSTISSNETTGANGAGNGAGIYNFGTLNMTGSTVSDNRASASSRAGGICNDGTLNVEKSTIGPGNSDGLGDGGITQQGTAAFRNTTISGNAGRGLFNGCANNAQAALVNCTIASNTGTGFENCRSVTMYSTIIAGNGTDCSIGGTFADAGWNIDSDNTCALSPLTGQPGADPMLGPLRDNGGATFTHALLSGSPAIDAGDNAGCPGADQRGFSRPRDGNGDGSAVCDVGAYEFLLPPPGAPPPTALFNSGGNEGCFIATAAYGSSLDPRVQALRDFRDRHLRTNAAGRAFMELYYACSPPIADYLRRHEAPRTAARWLLTPLAAAVGHPYSALTALLAIAGAAAGGGRRWRRARRTAKAGE